MNYRLPLLILALGVFAFAQAVAGADPHRVTYIRNLKERPDQLKQNRLRQESPWKQFSQKHDGWSVEFDERSKMPHRAYGKGFVLEGNDPVDRAARFIREEMGAFGVSDQYLELRNSYASPKFLFTEFFQRHEGLEVLNSRVTIRTTKDHRLVLFGADVFNDIAIRVQPDITEHAAAAFASNGISYTITATTVKPGLKILPVPAEGKYEYHLVYEAEVYAETPGGFPARYYTLVDAHTGQVHYRQNQIHTLDSELMVTGDVSDPHPYEPSVNHQLAYLRVNIAGTDYYTDAEGKLDLTGITLPAEATVYLQGTWSRVVSGNNSNTVSSFTTTLQEGANTITFDEATLEAVTAYYHVNEVHDFMKIYLPDYEQMDEDLETRVERTDGSCNAYYDGSSINFYKTGSGCYSLALTGDVVYHEYGHGISMRFHSWLGNGLSNGAINEGYSDVWGFSITDLPIIGIGISSTTADDYVRRYDINKKVYPVDIIGEVHADGEIIAGAWYDTRLNLGSVDAMMKIFTEALYGLADAANGQEGLAFRDVLIDALTADDDDGDILNGTPNSLAILDAFALHGITIISDITIDHNEPLMANAGQTITIQTEIDVDYPQYVGDMQLYYKTDTAATYTSLALTQVNGDMYEVQLPVQEKGTVIDYFFKVDDLYGYPAIEDPVGVQEADGNLPYKLLVGFESLIEEDLEIYAGDWELEANDDDAETGQWTMDNPVASYLINGVPFSLVQTGTDHTPTNSLNICAITGNALNGESAGTNDVDGGRNTLFSPEYDLTEYELPAISYYRWFSNDQGANPGNDPWRVYITNGDGAWIEVENTKRADHRWRANAFRVADYVSITDQVQLKFIASDSTMNNQDLDGQSLVEAALDDLFVWDLADEVGISDIAISNAVKVFPNPAADDVFISWPLSNEVSAIEIINPVGQLVYRSTATGLQSLNIPTAAWPNGVYTVTIFTGEGNGKKKFVVQH